MFIIGRKYYHHTNTGFADAHSVHQIWGLITQFHSHPHHSSLDTISLVFSNLSLHLSVKCGYHKGQHSKGPIKPLPTRIEPGWKGPLLTLTNEIPLHCSHNGMACWFLSCQWHYQHDSQICDVDLRVYGSASKIHNIPHRKWNFCWYISFAISLNGKYAKCRFCL